MDAKKFLLDFHRGPGDVLVMTSLVRDLKLTYGDRVKVAVQTSHPSIWKYNPYLDTVAPGEKFNRLQLSHRPHKPTDADVIGCRESRQGSRKHYTTVFHQVFQDRTGLAVEPLFSRPDFHLSVSERANPRIAGRYWVIIPGGKQDMTNKIWPQGRYQAVVDRLRPWGLSFVQEGTKKRGHIHQSLENVLCLLGQTSIRELAVNIYHAEGVICGCSLPMHLAAALEKPCVVLLGGREEPCYEHYSNAWGAFGPKAAPVRVPHRILHTLGQLPCCRLHGCWKRRVEVLPDGNSNYNRSLCERPLGEAGRKVPECMDRISVSHVVEAVMSYYVDGTLPPL